MKEYAVVGASSGTGLAITRLLASQGHTVRAIARKPPAATEFIKPVVADVSKPEAIAAALAGELEAIFFTVDIHKAFASKQLIRSVMFDGFVNVLGGAKSNKRNTKPPRIILLSVMGAGKSSLTWHLLNLAKRGMQKNIVDREQALVDSDLPYVIVRAPRLVDIENKAVAGAIEAPRPATAAMLSAQADHRLDMKRTIARPDLASAMIAAATSAPENSVWDVYGNDAGPVPVWMGVK